MNPLSPAERALFLGRVSQIRSLSPRERREYRRLFLKVKRQRNVGWAQRPCAAPQRFPYFEHRSVAECLVEGDMF